ncbi:hypothetical protein PHMEG_00031896 [Phytophthora megakarya]|uniref:Uncharacterized protein n=1 Tax=Phytophthora megakarya TaxID=4795 RepID=A0A225UWN7_9STRA|nr:hypothetical protein PHMEG_00031896 [Phytophthora megakarya]
MVHVVSYRFQRQGCSHSHSLFERECTSTSRESEAYLSRCFSRSNQEQSLPRYSPVPQCGCSIHVLVTFSHDMSDVPLHDLIMSTHFEQLRLEQVDASTDRLSEMDTFHVGQVVFLPDNLLSSEERNTTWTRASRVSDANLQHLSKVSTSTCTE